MALAAETSMFRQYFAQSKRYAWAGYAALLIAIALVGATSTWIKHASDPFELWPLLADELTSVLVILVLTPAIVLATVCLRPVYLNWLRVFFGHLAGFVAFSVLHVTGMIQLRRAIYPLFGAHYFGDGSLWLTTIYEGRKDALAYIAIVISVNVLMRLSTSELTATKEDIDTCKPIRIAYRNGAVQYWISADEIFWVEAAGNYVELVLESRRVLQRRSLRALEITLSEARFVRIHRSRIVNYNRIRSVVSKSNGDFTLVLTNNEVIAGSRRFRNLLLKFANGDLEARWQKNGLSSE